MSDWRRRRVIRCHVNMNVELLLAAGKVSSIPYETREKRVREREQPSHLRNKIENNGETMAWFSYKSKLNCTHNIIKIELTIYLRFAISNV